jgi:hypothetical protein
MKPLHIGILVIVAAVGGAVVMKVLDRPQAPTPAVAQNPAPAAAPAAQPAPPAAEPEAKPEPAAEPSVAEHRARPKPARRERAVPKDNPEPVAVAQNTPPPAAAPAPAPVAAPPAPAPEPVAPPPPPPPPPQVTLNAGLLIPVRLIDGLSTERNVTGDSFTGSLDQLLVVNGLVIAERGARVEGRVVSSDKGGRVKGVASIAVQLTRIHLSDGQTISVQTDSFERDAEASKKTDAAKVGAGAAIGAIIGAIAGGGKGAAVGAGVGGGAGAGDVLLTRGKPATLPSETKISFRLNTPLTVTEQQR